MRAREFITEEFSRAAIDWKQIATVMTATAITKGIPKGIDAIAYLGIIGDPGNSPIDIRYKSPAKIGLDVGKNGKGYMLPSVSGEYYYGDADIKNAGGYEILINYQDLKAADWSQHGQEDTITHEAMHRGLDIASRIPAIVSQVPSPAKEVLTQYRYAKQMPGRDIDPRGETIEHLMIYAMLQSGPTRRGGSRNMEEFQFWRSMYLQIEQAVKAYVLSYPVPPGGYESLRQVLDSKTPDNVDVSVTPGRDGRPVVTTTVEKPAADVAAQTTTPVAPTTTPVAPTTTPVAPTTTPVALTKIYTVQRNDNLTRIAQRFYKGRLSDLLRANPQFTANGRNPNLIYPGDQVVIPD